MNGAFSVSNCTLTCDPSLCMIYFCDCGRLEQALWWVRGVGDSADDSTKKCDTIMLQIKAVVYKMLSEIHKARGISTNYHHYTRLARQSLDVLRKLQHDVGGQDLYSDQLAVDVIHKYYKNYLHDDLSGKIEQYLVL